MKRVYFWFALLVACASAAVVAVAALVLHLDPLLSRSLLIVAVLGVLTSVGRWAIILLKADNQFSWAGSAEGCRSVGLLIATPLIYVLGLPGLWVGNLVGAAASTGLAWGRLRYRPRFRWNAVLLRRLIGFGVPIMLVLIAQIVSMTGDRILVLGFLALGIYGIGRTFTQILMASGGIVGPVVYPRITERYGRTGDAASLQRLVVAPTLVLAATLPLTIGVAWFGLPVIVEWLLPAFRPGILPAQILFVATAAYLLAGASDYLLIALRRQVLSLLLYVGAVALGLLLEYGALRVGWGLAGVAGGVALSSSVYAVVIIMAAQHHCRVPPKAQIRNVVRGLLPLGLAVVLCVAIDHFAPSQGHTPLLRAPTSEDSPCWNRSGLPITCTSSSACAHLKASRPRSGKSRDVPGWRCSRSSPEHTQSTTRSQPVSKRPVLPSTTSTTGWTPARSSFRRRCLSSRASRSSVASTRSSIACCPRW